MKFLLPVLPFLFCTMLSGASPDWTWFCSGAGGQKQLKTDDAGALREAASFRGSALVFRRENRHEFHASKERFDAAELVFEAVLHGAFKAPVKAWVFLKDKDGLWYQTEKEFKLYPGEPAILRVRLDAAGKELLPSGHSLAWNAQQASQIFEAGVSVYSEEDIEGSLDLHGPSFEGIRVRNPLQILYWNLPLKAARNRMFESQFALSREYFNPFDPDEIQVDFEIDDVRLEEPGPCTLFRDILALLSGGAEKEKVFDFGARPANRIFPAFYTQDFARSRHFTEETLLGTGTPYWAFRFTPEKTGPLRVRLRVTDRSGGRTEEIFSEWRTLEVEDSAEHGFIRVNPKNRHYFGYTDGTFFYPVGINIHTNIDRRSEYAFKWGKLPDRGVLDYEEYFKACGEAGITLAEVWMASWTCALEWDSARSGYAGAGRYNLRNAWKLDQLFRTALRHGIAINLVLAPHGELSFRNDQEWEDNPFNLKGPFAGANNAMLPEPEDFWSSIDIMKLTYRRNRYIAARWGASTNLFAYEFWSEVDLVNKAREQYDKGFMQLWHALAAQELHRMDSGGHLMSTHTCGDSGTTLHWRDITVDPSWHTHIVSDAYRSPSILYPDQMRKHRAALEKEGKPFQATEFGGTAFASSDKSTVVGDVHSALWASLFLGQSATSALWWHDFVHLNNLYPHYRAFADYIRGLDMTAGTPVFSDVFTPFYALPLSVTRRPEAFSDPAFLRKEYAKSFCCFLPGGQSFDWRASKLHTLLMTPDGKTGYGWVYLFARIMRYPRRETDVPLHAGGIVKMDLPLPPGSYRLVWIHTVTGRTVAEQTVVLDGFPRFLPVPPFRIDLAFKLIPQEGYSAP